MVRVADLAVRRRRNGVVPPALTSAAAIVRPSRNIRLNNYEWQREAWNFYRREGPLKYAMMWFSQTMSRVRLTAAIATPGGDEPMPITDGPAADLMKDFFNGPTGQSQYMRDMSLQLNVPGEGYVFAEDDLVEPGLRHWCVKSTSEVQVTSGKIEATPGQRGRSKSVELWQIEVDQGVWRNVPYDSVAFKQWRPDAEKSWQPDSPVQSALTILRIIDMLERRIIAMSVSRLASNGILLYPQEVTFPPKPGFEKEADPFTAEWLDIASKTIENPGSALAAIPMPIKVPKEFIDSFKHMDFANSYDERLVELLNLMYSKLADSMNMPREVLTGMGDSSHWNAWQLDDSAVNVHISPECELMVAGITTSYLHPALKAMNERIKTPDGEIVAWYDTSELTAPPDLSDAADKAYDRDEINGKSYRRYKGMSEQDRPTKSELREQLLIKMAHDPTQAPAAIEELTGTPVAGATPGPGNTDPVSPRPESTPAAGPPPAPVKGSQPPPPASTG